MKENMFNHACLLVSFGQYQEYFLVELINILERIAPWINTIGFLDAVTDNNEKNIFKIKNDRNV